MASAATILRKLCRSTSAPAAGLAAGLTALVMSADAAAAGVTVGACSRLEPRAAREVRVARAGDPIPPGHRLLAVLSMETGGPSGGREPTPDFWFARFRGPAARLGAHLVAGIQSVYFASRDQYFATALALAPGGMGSCERVVALGPIVNRCEAPDEMRMADDDVLRVAVGYALGRRGYFVTAVPDSAPPDGEARFPAATGFPAPLRFALEIGPGGETAVAEDGPVRLRATLTDASGDGRWTAELIEAFLDPAELGGAVLPGTVRSRSGHLLAAVERLVEGLPVPAAAPAARASTP